MTQNIIIKVFGCKKIWSKIRKYKEKKKIKINKALFI